MHKFLNLIILSLILFSCEHKAKETGVAFALPPGAIPFEYNAEKQNTIPINDTLVERLDFAWKRAILLSGTLNDSIPLKLFFDTGYPGREILVSDSLQGMLKESDNFLQIDDTKSLIKPSFLDKNHWFFRYLGANAAVIGWKFFENKIVEISYQHKYIRELENIPQSSEYKQVKIDSILLAPVKIFIQGKWITVEALVDTGNNGLLDLNTEILNDYSISMDGAQLVTGLDAGGESQKWFISFDSISVCGYSIPASHPLGVYKVNGKYKPRMLGNAFFENFEVILDLKEYNLYLKPIK